MVLLDELKEREHALRVAEKVVNDCRQPLRLESGEVTATASIGVAYATPAMSEEALLKSADAALYDAKAEGRDRYRVAP